MSHPAVPAPMPPDATGTRVGSLRPGIIRLAAAAISALSLVFQAGAPAHAQAAAPASGGLALHGRVVESEVLSGLAARVQLLGTDLIALRDTVTDAAGTFVFADVAPGSYLVQATAAGRSSALVAATVVAPVVGAAREPPLTVVVPSAVLESAASCPAARAGAVLAGVVHDADTDVPLPGARVTVAWDALAGPPLEATTDRAGLYRFCQVPVGATVRVAVTALGRSATSTVQMPPALLARADLGLTLGIGTSTLRVLATTLQPDPAASPEIAGRIVARGGDAPVGQVVVRVAGDTATAVSDDEGRFRLTGMPPGDVVLEVEHLAFGTHREVLRVERGSRTEVELALAPRAIPLAPVEVAGAAAARLAARVSPSRAAVFFGAELAIAEARGAQVVDFVRNVPGLTVMEGTFTTKRGLARGYCVTSTRRVQAFLAQGTASAPACEPLPVMIDGVPVGDPVDFLRLLDVRDYESIQVVGAIEAQMLLGLAGGGAGGAILLWTRGRGPFTTNARNVPPQ